MRIVALAIFLASFLAFGWMSPQNQGNVQLVTRLGLTLSIVEFGELNIDRFEGRTVDKSLFEGHYYSDKTPGHSLIAVPPVWVARQVANLFGVESSADSLQAFDLFLLVATVAVNGLASAAAAALLYVCAVRLGAGHSGAVLGALALGFATPFFGFSTAFFPHSLSGSLLAFIGAALVFNRTAGFLAGRPLAFGAVVGVLAGVTLAVDLTTAPSVAVLLGLALLLALRDGAAAAARMAAGMAGGGFAGLLPLPVYNFVVFGNPFVLGYSKVVGFEGMQQGFFGISSPDLRVLAEILVGSYRGLLPLSPVLVLVLLGLGLMAARPATRAPAVAVLFCILSFLWINASYFYWDGGHSTGPRHLVPALPLACLSLAFLWRTPWLRPAVVALLVPSLVLSLVCAAAGMFAPDRFQRPLTEFILPAYLGDRALWLRSLPVVAIWLGFAWLVPQANAARLARWVGAGPPAIPR